MVKKLIRVGGSRRKKVKLLSGRSTVAGETVGARE